MKAHAMALCLALISSPAHALDPSAFADGVDDLVNELFLHDARQAFRDGDYESAREKYLILASRGSASAQISLGEMYEEGLGGDEDFAEAFAWYERAAKQGHDEAQLRLARMYYFGREVPTDYIKTYAWLYLAAIQGNTKARRYRDEVVKLLEPEQLTEARRLASAWTQRYNR